jgi:hypothetical protein
MKDLGDTSFVLGISIIRDSSHKRVISIKLKNDIIFGLPQLLRETFQSQILPIRKFLNLEI